MFNFVNLLGLYVIKAYGTIKNGNNNDDPRITEAALWNGLNFADVSSELKS